MLSLIYLNYICAKKSLKMPMEQSEAVIRMTDNCTMVKRKRKKRQTLNRKRTMEQNDPPPPKKNPKPGGELSCSGSVIRSCSTS